MCHHLTEVGTAGFRSAAMVEVLAAVLPLRPIWRAFGRPRPERPQGFPVWPLWFAPLAFLHARRAGALFVIGLVADALLAA
jgi:1,4-dihydroxy-2-naphthoate octaprenyltransferase